MRKFPIPSKLKDQRGVTAIIVGLVMFMLLGFAALAIDLTHLYVVRNELQNAADAGALAGARDLYLNDGTAVNPGANQTAYDTATANRSETVAVEVNWTSGNTGDIQRGHWTFATRTFTPNASLAPTDLWDVSDDELDADLNFINAVRSVTRREFNPPVASFFARIFGYGAFQLSAWAVAYIGFAGTLTPFDVTEPIALCEESLLTPTGDYSCNIGRMINSGQNVQNSETGGWTSFDQEDNPCNGGTNAQEVKSLVCSGGNPDPIDLGAPIATTGGQIQSAFQELIDCWDAGSSNKTQPWEITLVVISCPGNNVGTCEEVTGAVTVNVVWITGAGADPQYNNAPTQMGGWSNNDPDGEVRWNDFVTSFTFQNVDGTPAPYNTKSIYFLPDCTSHDPIGHTGGTNYGILAKVPVLVR